MRRALLAVVLVLSGCATTTTPSDQAPSPAPSASAATERGPRFADLTQGSTTSVVKLHEYDPANASAVVEPILFMTGDAYCRTFELDESECFGHAWMTEESKIRVTVPIAADVDYFTWEGGPDGEVCVDAPEKGGTCPISAKEFGAWFEREEDDMVAVATKDGALTRMAVVYTP